MAATQATTTNFNKGSPTLPKLNPISPSVDRGDDDTNMMMNMRVASPQIKQEPTSHDGTTHIDSYHSMSEALQTVSH